MIKKSITLLTGLLIVLSSYGQTVRTVTNLFDSGTGSLRATLAAALPGDTIRFQARGPIFLTTAPLSVAKDIYVDGPGMDSLTINGNSARQVFVITAGNTTMRNLAISQGFAAGTNGAGIDFTGDTLTLEGVHISRCQTTAGGDGAGVYANCARVKILNSLIERNRAMGNSQTNYMLGGSCLYPNY